MLTIMSGNKFITNRRALLAAAIAAVISGNASAQDAAADDGSQQSPVEEVLVTGSRIARAGLDTPSPVTVVGRAEFESRGVSSVGELLRELSLSGGLSGSDGAGRFNGAFASVALRGLSPVNTLVLINGRRQLATNRTNEVDLNGIPFEAVERIEVLQDGASAIYGSDAIAGVVNIITRKDYTGLQFSAEYGESSRGDAPNKKYAMTYGSQFDKGGIVFTASHRTQDGFKIASRPVSSDPDQRPYGGPNLRGQVPGDGRAVVRNVPGLDPTLPYTIREGVTQVTSINDLRVFNVNAVPSDGGSGWAIENSQADIDLSNLWFNGHYNFTDSIEGFVEIGWNRTQAFSGGAIQGFLPQFGDPVVLSANNDYNPFGVDIPISRSFWEMRKMGNNQIRPDSTHERYTLGVRGPFGDSSWAWDVSANLHRFDQYAYTGEGVMLRKLQEAAGDSDVCRTIAGCVPINLLGGPDTVTMEMLRPMLATTHSDADASLDSYQFNVTGTLFDLPAGPVQLAAGIEYREETFRLVYDRASSREYGNLINRGMRVSQTPPPRTIKEGYVEAAIPLFGGLDMDVAARYSEYSQFGDTINPKVGLRWRATDDVLLRASYGTGFRAPNWEEAYATQNRTFQPVNDPCTGADFAQFPVCNGQQVPITGAGGAFVIVGSNVNLGPEESTNFTLGLVWTPSFLDGFSVTLDAWRIEKEEVISTANPNFVILQNALTGAFPGRVVRDPATNRIFEVNSTVDNIGQQELQGYDLGLAYQLQTGSLGEFEIRADISYLDKFMLPPAPLAEMTDRVGNYETALGTLAQWRSTGGVLWNSGSWSASYAYRFVDGVRNVSFSPNHDVDSYLAHDISGTYAFTAFDAETFVTLGVKNVLDEMPPRIFGHFSNGFDTGSFNSMGRFFFVRAGVAL